MRFLLHITFTDFCIHQTQLSKIYIPNSRSTRITCSLLKFLADKNLATKSIESMDTRYVSDSCRSSLLQWDRARHYL